MFPIATQQKLNKKLKKTFEEVQKRFGYLYIQYLINDTLGLIFTGDCKFKDGSLKDGVLFSYILYEVMFYNAYIQYIIDFV